MPANFLSRRGFLKGLATGAGALAGTRLAPGASELVGTAAAAPAADTPHVVVVYTLGGYSSIFTSAAPLVGKFGVTATNYTGLGNGVTVDDTYANAFDAYAKAHMAVIGVRHGLSAHFPARLETTSNGSRNYFLMLADALGGSAAIKCALLGDTQFIHDLPTKPEGSASLQSITDVKPTIAALGGASGDPRTPDRAIAAGAIVDTHTMSRSQLDANPTALARLDQGYAASIDTLRQPAQPFDFGEIAQAYSLPAGQTALASNKDFRFKMAAAELMVRAGTNVTWVLDHPIWDSHGDSDGVRVRNFMSTRSLPPIATFARRMLQMPGKNVVLVIMGEFARSLPHSDHQPNLSVTVMWDPLESTCRHASLSIL